MLDTAELTVIGPEHHGTRMPLEQFARAKGRPGHLYELEKGVIVVVPIPGLPHGRVVQEFRDAFSEYRRTHPGVIDYVGGGGEAGLQMPEMQSERHPDVAVYLTAPLTPDPQPWEDWTPDLVIEVVSQGGEDRDYRIKRDEYLRAGTRLYWVVDPQTRTVLVLTRRGDTWREKRVAESSTLTTALLPGFELMVAQIFAVLR